MKKLRIAITGASGMLGTAMLDCFAEGYDVFANSRSKGYCKPGINWYTFDLLHQTQLVKWLEEVRPQFVVHSAAIVSMDGCEKDPEHAYALHVKITEIIVNTIRAWGGRLIYISTDAVFDGRQDAPYSEENEVHPMSVYGKTKLEGEQVALRDDQNIVLRTTIFGWSQAEGRCSFAEWVLKGLMEKKRLTMFTDVYFTPIHVSHLAQIIAKIFRATNARGLFHATGCSVLSKYEFALKMAEVFGLDPIEIAPISVEDSGLIAVRAKNMALLNTKLSHVLHCQFPTIDEGLAYLKMQYDNKWLEKIKGSQNA